MEALRAYQAPPPWLAAATDADVVADAIRRDVRDLRAGRLRLDACEVEDLRLKDGRWIGRYLVTVQNPTGQTRDISLTGLLDAHGAAIAAPGADLPFASPGWSVALAGPPLTLCVAAPDRRLPALPTLTGPATARAWLERSLSEAFPGIRLASCEPSVTRYRPGQRCTVVCGLAYADNPDPAWPEVVVGKVHRRGGAAPGHAALAALAAADVGTTGTLELARPLAYVATDDVSVQSYLSQDRSLIDRVSRAATGDQQGLAAAQAALQSVAGALAALHRAPFRHGRVRVLADEVEAVTASADKLGAVFPRLRGAVEPLLRLVEERAAAVVADAPKPSHGAFRPAQVRLAGGRVGVLDLDDFGQSEPAQDLGRFVGKLRLLALRAATGAGPDLPDRHAIADQLAWSFLERYGDEATVSRVRVTLWETLDLAKALLQSWSRGRPAQIDAVLTLLEDRVTVLQQRS